MVNGGEVVQLSSTSPINNNKWHTIYWEADARGMKLRVDSKTALLNRTLILPSALHWSIGLPDIVLRLWDICRFTYFHRDIRVCWSH